MRLLVSFILCSVSVLGQVKSIGPADENVFTEGMMLFVLEEYPRALEQFDVFLKSNNGSAAAHYMKSRTELALNQLQQAEVSAENAVRMDNTRVPYLKHLASVLQANFKYNAAQEIWGEVIRFAPDDLNAYFSLLELQSAANDTKGALKTLERAEKQFGASEKLTRARQALLIKENKVEAAFKEGQKMADKNPEFVLDQAALLIKSNKVREAVALLEDAVTEHPDLVNAYGLLSELYATHGSKQSSWTLLQKVVADPSLPYSLKVNVVGNHMRAFGQDEATVSDLTVVAEDLARTHPDQARAYIYAGDLSYRQGKVVVARDYYAQAVALDKNQYEVWLALLQIGFSLGDMERLEKEADQATLYFPNQSSIWFYLGWAQWQNKRRADAELAFEEVIRLKGSAALVAAAQGGLALLQEKPAVFKDILSAHADNPHLRYMEAVLALEERADNAATLAMSLSDQFPDNLQYRLLLAKSLVVRGQASEALSVLQSGENASLGADFYDVMGDALLSLGRAEEARNFWRKALERDQNNTIIQKKLEEL